MTSYIDSWRERYEVRATQADLWRARSCDDSSPIDSLPEAQFTLTEHSGHGGACRRYAAAMRRATGSSI